MKQRKLSSVVCSFLAATAVVLSPRAHAGQDAMRGKLAVSRDFWSQEIRGGARLQDIKLDRARVPGAVAVITAEEIRGSGARSLQEVLSRELGIVQFDEIGNSFQTVTDLRGFNASPVPATAVIVDGVRVNEATFGQVNYQLIPIESIERIEIHPGPSTLYGKNALAGVIHISTKRGGTESAGEAGMAGGSNNRSKGWASVGGSLSGFDYFLSSTKERDYGDRRHSDAEIGTSLVKLGRKYGDRSDIVVSYTRADDKLEQPGSLTGAEIAADRRQNISAVDNISKMDFLTVNQRQALPFDFSLALSGALRERTENSPLNRGRSSVSRYVADMRSRSLTAQLSRQSEMFGRQNVIVVGAESVNNEADSASAGFFGSFPFTSGNFAKENSEGLFAQGVMDLIPDSLVLTSGLRYEETKTTYQDKIKPSKSGEQYFNRTNPRVGLNYNHPSGWGTYALYSEAFRTPTVSEISALGPFGGSLLKPVKAKNYEAGASTLLGEDVEFRVSLYRTDARDEIYPVFDATAGFGKNINVDRIRRTGVEWGLKARRGIVDVSVNHTLTKATFESPMTLDKAPWPATQKVEKGADLPLVPRHRVAAGVSVHPLTGWTLTMDGLCLSERRMVSDEGNLEPKLPAQCTANLGSSYEKEGWRLFVRGTNVFNGNYASRGIMATNPATSKKEAFLIPAPQFQVYGGVSYRFSTGSAEAKTASVKTSAGASK